MFFFFNVFSSKPKKWRSQHAIIKQPRASNLHPKQSFSLVWNLTKLSISIMVYTRSQYSANQLLRSSIVSTKGLLNGPGQNNCFLNCAVQVSLFLKIQKKTPHMDFEFHFKQKTKFYVKFLTEQSLKFASYIDCYYQKWLEFEIKLILLPNEKKMMESKIIEFQTKLRIYTYSNLKLQLPILNNTKSKFRLIHITI